LKKPDGAAAGPVPRSLQFESVWICTPSALASWALVTKSQGAILIRSEFFSRSWYSFRMKCPFLSLDHFTIDYTNHRLSSSVHCGFALCLSVSLSQNLQSKNIYLHCCFLDGRCKGAVVQVCRDADPPRQASKIVDQCRVCPRAPSRAGCLS